MSQPRPLKGIRVIDFTSLVAGPWCTRLLADCGAEVIKIEPVSDGEVMRYAQPAANGVSRAYAHFNVDFQVEPAAVDQDIGKSSYVALAMIIVAITIVANFERISLNIKELVENYTSRLGKRGKSKAK